LRRLEKRYQKPKNLVRKREQPRARPNEPGEAPGENWRVSAESCWCGRTQWHDLCLRASAILIRKISSHSRAAPEQYFPPAGIMLVELLTLGALDQLSANELAEVCSWFTYDNDRRLNNAKVYRTSYNIYAANCGRSPSTYGPSKNVHR